MLWIFEREGESLQCEIRPSTFAAGVELEIKLVMDRSALPSA